MSTQDRRWNHNTHHYPLLLSKHMTLLEDAGYIEITKGYQGKRPRTWFALTEAGRAAFGAYLAALNEIVGSGPDQPPPPAAPAAPAGG